MTDKTTIRIVVGSLALGVLCGLVLMGWLASTQTPIPDPIDRLVSMLAGALIGVLASTRSTPDAGDPPQPVHVVNEAADPVPVDNDP